MSATSAIETRGLTKQFGPLRAVDDLDLAVERGEVFGWLGPNGAGKTTTVRLLLDALRPTAGTATVLGGAPRDPAIRRRIGYLPGDLALDPSYTANDVFDFFGALRGMRDGTRRSQLVERFGLDPTRKIRELSTGNRRKIGIVQAFMHRPEVLILDEPTSGLDPLLQHQFNGIVRDAVGEGATVFLSSHVLPEVEVLADRVGILRAGRLVALSTIDDLRRQARQRITFVVDGDADAAWFGGLDEVVEATAAGDHVVVVVEGPVDRVLKAAAQHPVLRVTSHDDDLEDVFLRYYADPHGGRDASP